MRGLLVTFIHSKNLSLEYFTSFLVLLRHLSIILYYLSYALTAYFLRGKARSFFCCFSVLALA